MLRAAVRREEMNMIREKIKLMIALVALAAGVPIETAALSSPDDLKIDVWLDRGDGSVYHQGEAVTVYFKTSEDCFVTVYNIDTDGNIGILFPTLPGEGNYVEGGATYYIPMPEHESFFVIDEPAGMGYVEAVASHQPFSLAGWPFYAQGGSQPHHAEGVVERISGDPFLAIEEINSKILPFGEDVPYADDFAVYYVETVVDYPRYVCNDCHTPAYYSYDPYYYPCSYVNIVVFDYWWYNRWYYVDYWWVDYYPYWDYYYYAPPPPYLGRHYTRKYGYTRKVNDGYTTKGYGDKGGVVRVNDSYKGKEVMRGNFKALGTENNPVLAYRPPKVAEQDRSPVPGVERKNPVAEGRRDVPPVSAKPPVAETRAGSKENREIQTKAPAMDERSRSAGAGKGTTPKATVLGEKRQAAEEPARVTVKPPAYEERPRREGTVAGKAPVREESRERVEGRKEYQLRGWDRGKSGDTRKSSGISIIRSEPKARAEVKGSKESAPRTSAPRMSVPKMQSGHSAPHVGKSSGIRRK